MKIALLSDIHANLPALEAVLADIDRRAPDLVFCLGDLVGYATWPNECVDLIRQRRIPTIAGNYDVGVGLGSDDCGCAYKTESEKANGAASIAFTNATIHEANRAWLRALPRHIALDFEQEGEKFRLLLVHGSPRKVNEYLFEDRDEKSLLRIMQDAQAQVMAFGHTHKPYHRILPDTSAGFRHAINTGSVGKPKDGDPRACYVMLDIPPAFNPSRPDLIGVEFVRVDYPQAQTAAAILASPLPYVFADMILKAY